MCRSRLLPFGRQGAALVACALALALAPAEAQAPGDLRVALVIGNAAYPGKARLENPVNDARGMTEAMRRLGFRVIDVQDATQARMQAAITQMRTELQGRRGVGLLYYAGHGVQYDWRNFMVPVDARLQSVTDIPERTVDVAAVLEAFKTAGNRLNLVVLDACRDNPFDNELATKGLAPVDAPPGTFMAFATAAGNVAADAHPAGGGNGLYTRLLLEELGRPAARLEDVFKRVKLQVRQQSGGRQVPWESTNLDEEFSFDRGFARPDAGNAQRLARFDAERSEWNRIRESRNAADFVAFLQRYPSGFMSEIAQFRYDHLQQPLLVAQAQRNSVTTLASGTNRFALGDQFTWVVTDRLTRVVRRDPQRVTFANDERVEINGGAFVYDQLGGVLRDDSGDKDPPILMVPADITLGKRWRSLFQNRISGFELRTVVDFKTVGLEELDLEGTRVQAFKVDFEGFANTVRLEGSVWIDPRTMRMVRWDRMVRIGGAILDSSSILVTEYRPAPR